MKRKRKEMDSHQAGGGGKCQGGATCHPRADPEAEEVGSFFWPPSLPSVALSPPRKGAPELRVEVGNIPLPHLPSLWALGQRGEHGPCPRLQGLQGTLEVPRQCLSVGETPCRGPQVRAYHSWRGGPSALIQLTSFTLPTGCACVG